MKIVGFSGLKGSGKSFLAEHLVKKYGYERYSYADPIKKAVAAILNVSYDWVHHNKENYIYFGDDEISVRRIIQTLGTEWGRDTISTNIWVFSLLSSIKASGNFNKFVVIDDVRFDNEAKAIKEKGGVIINIDSHIESGDSHASEQITKISDFKIYNDFTENTLKELDKIIKKVDARYKRMERVKAQVTI